MNNTPPLPTVQFQVKASQDIFKTAEKTAKKNRLINKITRITWNIFSIIVFPIGIARLTVFAAKQLASFVILPAAGMFNLEEKKKELKKNPSPQLQKEIDKLLGLHRARGTFIKDPSKNAEQVTVRTADGIDLDTLTIEHKSQQSQPHAQQKWIVYFLGNVSCYEDCLDELKVISDQTEASVLVGNFRGVMRSKGSAKSSHDLVLDGEAMVQSLLQKGVTPENILIHGWSLGGAVGTQVAALHQEEGHEMHLCSERSFSSTEDVIKSKIKGPFGAIAAPIVRAAGWEFDSLQKFQTIKGHKFTIHAKEDGLIRHKASLYKRLKMKQRTGKPKNAIKIVLDENEVSQEYRMSLPAVRRQWGDINHCFHLTKMKVPFQLYTKHAREALSITA